MEKEKKDKCSLKEARCPVCKSDINFKKKDKGFCNCKNQNCHWRCLGHCE